MTNIFKLGILTSLLCLLECAIPSPPGNDTDYKEVIRLSLLYYETQRSGRLPITNRIPWRGDSALDDTGHRGEDLTGGYYESSGFVKFTFTMAFTTTILSWGMISFPDAYEKSGQYREALDAIRWATDYLLKCHTKPYEFYAQVGDFRAESVFWGRPEEMNTTRNAYKIDKEHPGTDLAGEGAAALAAASIVFNATNPQYSRELLKHAKQLLDFADEYVGLYHSVIPGTRSFYESTGYGDELVWAHLWLYKATKDDTYLDYAEIYYDKYGLKDRPNEFSFNKKAAGIQVLLAEGNPSEENYAASVKDFCDFCVFQQERTPKGLMYVAKFGTLSYAANAAFICLEAAKMNISRDVYINFAKQQIDYMLGSSGRSFVVGYGENYPLKPLHAASSCPDLPLPCNYSTLLENQPNYQILYGALVSGPDINDRYVDDRIEFLYNEVTPDYNAGFQSALAGLVHFLD